MGNDHARITELATKITEQINRLFKGEACPQNSKYPCSQFHGAPTMLHMMPHLGERLIALGKQEGIKITQGTGDEVMEVYLPYAISDLEKLSTLLDKAIKPVRRRELVALLKEHEAGMTPPQRRTELASLLKEIEFPGADELARMLAGGVVQR